MGLVWRFSTSHNTVPSDGVGVGAACRHALGLTARRLGVAGVGGDSGAAGFQDHPLIECDPCQCVIDSEAVDGRITEEGTIHASPPLWMLLSREELVELTAEEHARGEKVMLPSTVWMATIISAIGGEVKEAMALLPEWSSDQNGGWPSSEDGVGWTKMVPVDSVVKGDRCTLAFFQAGAGPRAEGAPLLEGRGRDV